MKILHITGNLSRRGLGVCKVVEELARVQTVKGYLVQVHGYTDQDWLDGDSKDWVDIDVVTSTKSVASVIQGIQLILRFQPAIVHVHGLWAPYNLCVLIAWLFADFKIIVSPHGMLSQEALGFGKFKKLLASFLYQKPLFRVASAIHVTSGSERDEVSKYGISVGTYIAPNGVSDYRRLSIHEKRKKLVVYVGRLHPKKGLELLIHAWNEVIQKNADWSLQISGTGSEKYRALLEGKIAPHAKDSIHITQGVFEKKFDDLLLQASIFILPSLSESWPLSIGQAMVRELPIITTTKTPFTFLSEIEAGVCVEPEIVSIAEALEHLMQMSGDELSVLGVNSRNWAINNLSWEEIAIEHIKEYDRHL